MAANCGGGWTGLEGRVILTDVIRGETSLATAPPVAEEFDAPACAFPTRQSYRQP